MKPENRARAPFAIGFAVVLALAVIGAYVFSTSPLLASSLPIPAGTLFTGSETSDWVAHFDVPSVGGRVVGAWTAFEGREVPGWRSSTAR